MLDGKELKSLERICKDYKNEKGVTIAILQEIQEEFGYIPESAVNWIADRLDIPRSKFFGITTFYAQFYLTPRGKNIITCCSGTACHVKGSERIITAIRRELNLEEGEDITEDRLFTLEKVNCVGTCSMAPVAIINKKIYGQMTANKLIKEIKTLVKKV